jgi:transposase
MSNQIENKEIFVGIDVSKATLYVAVHPTGQQWQFSNDDKGCREALQSLLPLKPTLIVMEATGGLETSIAVELSMADLSVAIVNPRQVRDFAKAMGHEEKWKLHNNCK